MAVVPWGSRDCNLACGAFRWALQREVVEAETMDCWGDRECQTNLAVPPVGKDWEGYRHFGRLNYLAELVGNQRRGAMLAG